MERVAPETGLPEGDETVPAPGVEEVSLPALLLDVGSPDKDDGLAASTA
jgi:hypothetical protein